MEMTQKEDLNKVSMATKRFRGHKRHLMVDVLEVVLSCFASAANVADANVTLLVLIPTLENNSRLFKILADQSHRGAIAVLLQQSFSTTLKLTEKLGRGFVVEP